MKEYIEREAVLDRLAKVDMDTYYGFTAAVQFGVDHAIQCIKEAPAADVAPVRHAKCEKIDLDDGKVRWRCSKCKREILRYDPIEYRYCPNCGALMDGEEDEHDKHPSDPV